MDQRTDAGVERAVDARETHISTLFFGPDRVYKHAKAIRTDYLDQSTPDRRATLLRTELEVNRRFSPDVYLGVTELHEGGTLADAVLVMRRLPSDRALTRLLGHGDDDDLLRRVAHRIASVHADAPPVHDERPMTTARGLLGLWESSLADIRPHVGTVIDTAEYDEVARLARTYLRHSDRLFDERRRQGHVRDGHGDLTAADVFVLDDGPRILDALAFDDDLRISDVLADIGFLVMDVERLAGIEAAVGLLRYYDELTNEHHPASLAHHYVAYRAHVRAKIALLRVSQGDDAAADEARRYHAQTLDHLRRARRRIVLVGGAPGTGKTTVARELAAALNWSVIDSDALRKDLAGVDHDDHRVDEHPGLYSADMDDQVYAELCRHAGVMLRAGESVILDATWSHARHRDLAREVADAHGAELFAAECVLSPEVAAERVRRRQVADSDTSDATPELAVQLAGARDRWPDAHRLDTQCPTAEAVDVLVDMLTDPVDER